MDRTLRSVINHQPCPCGRLPGGRSSLHTLHPNGRNRTLRKPGTDRPDIRSHPAALRLGSLAQRACAASCFAPRRLFPKEAARRSQPAAIGRALRWKSPARPAVWPDWRSVAHGNTPSGLHHEPLASPHTFTSPKACPRGPSMRSEVFRSACEGGCNTDLAHRPWFFSRSYSAERPLYASGTILRAESRSNAAICTSESRLRTFRATTSH